MEVGGVVVEHNAIWSPPSKAAIFSGGTDLFSMEMSYNSRGFPGPNWGLASLRSEYGYYLIGISVSNGLQTTVY